MTSLRSFDDTGAMIRTGRGCVGRRGVVSSGRAEASEIGASILERGGNAIDAAVATAFALGVCEPNASGIGGGGFMLLRDGRAGDVVFLDFREKAPMAVTPDFYPRPEDGSNVAADQSNIYGGKSVAVPGDVRGLLYALERYGTMTPRDVIAPAVKLAREGYLVTPLLHEDIKAHREQLLQYGDGWRIYLKDGAPYPVGAVLRNPDLADTLERIAEGGADVFYKGDIARRIVEAVQRDGGVMTLQDLADYAVRVREPVRTVYRGVEVVSSPPPSSGGTHVVEILNTLENFDVGALTVNSPVYLHLFSEVFKMAYADRAAYMGDPAFVNVPLTGLLNKDYAKTLAARIDLTKAHAPACGDPKQYESISTTHFSIGDREGNLVAVTKTINHFFGSCVVPEGLGFLLNDQMCDFSIDPSSPNCVLGGKIPLSSMSPTFLLRDGRPMAVVGSPGGIRIISTVAQVVSKLADHGMTVEEAVCSPRMADALDGVLLCEGRVPRETTDALEAMGHKVRRLDDWDRVMGSANSIQYTKDGIVGQADPRRDGFAKGI